MTINRARIGSVSLDCPDSTTLAGVFATLFGVEVAYDTEGCAVLRLDGI
ncbi:MAG: hypothetical protein ACYCWN_09585 [Ferrimicrobium sp.]|uniref:Uncharacterized protein n=1 Tax=Ferrimicrobium acidiphilum TaxID=121039 RepID=A0ABV3Y2B3_9ACTN|nr:hypothetical protein [Ferrimicrobium sp.]